MVDYIVIVHTALRCLPSTAGITPWDAASPPSWIVTFMGSFDEMQAEAAACCRLPTKSCTGQPGMYLGNASASTTATKLPTMIPADDANSHINKAGLPPIGPCWCSPTKHNIRATVSGCCAAASQDQELSIVSLCCKHT